MSENQTEETETNLLAGAFPFVGQIPQASPVVVSEVDQEAGTVTYASPDPEPRPVVRALRGRQWLECRKNPEGDYILDGDPQLVRVSWE